MRLLRDLIQQAIAHQGGIVRHPDRTAANAQVIPQTPAAITHVRVTDADPIKHQVRALNVTELRQRGIVGRVATLPANDNHQAGQRAADFLPAGTAAGKQTALSASILANSLVAAAGASIVVVPSSIEATEASTRLVKRPGAFATVDAARMTLVNDGDDVAVSPSPVKSAPIKIADAPSYGVAFELSRAQLRDLSDEVTTDALWAAIGLGLAAKADEVLLASLNSASLPAFTVGAAAARGLRWSELSAIAGVDADTTTTVDAVGNLRVKGVRAELTSQSGKTVVGCFERSAVAIGEELSITALRLRNGGVQVVVWANIQPLVPDETAFWSVA